MKFKKFIIAALALVAVLCLAACGEPVNCDADEADIAAKKDDKSVYDEIGAKITIADVTERENGLADVTYGGKTYECGMDFLSMAMVYNCTPAGAYDTEEKVYNQWWKLYIQRWNYLMPEIPLYSNQYYDVYAAKLSNFVTSPYWGAAKAIVGASSTDKAAIIGSSTELSGLFRSSAFGKSSPGASDLDIEKLTTGYDTVVSGIGGSYFWNEDVVKSHESKSNEDGTLTYTIEIKTGLKDSKNQEITADYYIASTIVANTPVYGAAGGSSSGSTSLVGYEEFLAYDGTNAGVKNEDDVTPAKYFKAIQKLSEYKWAVTIAADYAGYYYSITLGGFSPKDPAIYLNGAKIVVEEGTNNVGLEDKFYEKETKDNAQVFVNAAKIKANINNNDPAAFAYTGPFVVFSYDESAKVATLKKNEYYVAEKYRTYQEAGTPGNIETLSYVKVVTETSTDQLKAGEVNILEGITGGTETNAALELVKTGDFKETHYDRAGYGKLAFKCDYGPTSFTKVRQAITYTINREKFAQDFTGGYGSVVDGPYYKGSTAYAAVKDSIILNSYDYDTEDAKKLLEDDGWVYSFNAKKGKITDWKEGTVRYKKLDKADWTEANLFYCAKDNAYKTVKVDGEYYMPLVINWYGTPADENEVTALLKTAWEKSEAVKELGFYITATEGDFNVVLYGGYYQMADYGYDRGNRPIISCANFATGFNSAVYDQSYYWSINEDYYMDYNCVLMDAADFLANYNN